MSGEDLSWIPATCPGGHPLGPGRLSLTWRHCDCRPGHNGHSVVYCTVIECRAGPALPPGCHGRRSDR